MSTFSYAQATNTTIVVSSKSSKQLPPKPAVSYAQAAVAPASKAAKAAKPNVAQVQEWQRHIALHLLRSDAHFALALENIVEAAIDGAYNDLVSCGHLKPRFKKVTKQGHTMTLYITPPTSTDTPRGVGEHYLSYIKRFDDDKADQPHESIDLLNSVADFSGKYCHRFYLPGGHADKARLCAEAKDVLLALNRAGFRHKDPAATDRSRCANLATAFCKVRVLLATIASGKHAPAGIDTLQDRLAELEIAFDTVDNAAADILDVGIGSPGVMKSQVKSNSDLLHFLVDWTLKTSGVATAYSDLVCEHKIAPYKTKIFSGTGAPTMTAVHPSADPEYDANQLIMAVFRSPAQFRTTMDLSTARWYNFYGALKSILRVSTLHRHGFAIARDLSDADLADACSLFDAALELAGKKPVLSAWLKVAFVERMRMWSQR